MGRLPFELAMESEPGIVRVDVELASRCCESGGERMEVEVTWARGVVVVSSEEEGEDMRLSSLSFVDIVTASLRARALRIGASHVTIGVNARSCRYDACR